MKAFCPPIKLDKAERQRAIKQERQRAIKQERQRAIKQERQRAIKQERQRAIKQERQRAIKQERQRAIKQERQRAIKQERQRAIKQERQRAFKARRAKKMKTKTAQALLRIKAAALFCAAAGPGALAAPESALGQPPPRRFPAIPSKHDSGVIYRSKSKAFPAEYFLLSDYDKCSLWTVSGKFKANFPGGMCRFDPAAGFFSAINHRLYMFNKNMEPVWNLKFERIHHDLHISPPRREAAVVFSESRQSKKHGFIVNHGAAVADYKGRLIFKWTVLDALGDLEKITAKYGRTISKDSKSRLFKINSAQIIPENRAFPKNPAFQPGNLLLHLDFMPLTIAVRRKDGKIVWHYFYPGGGDSIHSPRILKSGRMLYFNNQFSGDMTNSEKRGLLKNKFALSLDGISLQFLFALPDAYLLTPFKRSSADIIDPLAKKLLWRYSPPIASASLVSPYGGWTQFLENGNIMVTHVSYGGAAFEVTPRGEIVWEWINPERHPYSKRPKNTRALLKIQKQAVEPFLSQTF